MGITTELLDRHRNNDADATRKLIAALMPWVAKFKVWHLRKIPSHVDKDELESTLYLDLCVAVDRLKRNDVAAEGVEQYVKNELQHSWKRCLRDVSEDVLGPDDQVIERESLSETQLEDQRIVGQELMDKEEYQALVDVAQTKLEHQVAGLLLSGYDAVDIADEFHGITVSQVENILKRLKERRAKQQSIR
ncbi:MAG: hypothetical protein AB7G28_02795 [Pirellulales bacterium]